LGEQPELRADLRFGEHRLGPDGHGRGYEYPDLQPAAANDSDAGPDPDADPDPDPDPDTDPDPDPDPDPDTDPDTHRNSCRPADR
jgi:hypothetical protein